MRHLLPVLLAAMGCSGPVATTVRPVHGQFEKSAYQATWQRAMDALRAEGFEISIADDLRGFAVTREREASAPCGEQRCLTRDTALLKLEQDGRATLTIHRQTWDAAASEFRPVSDPAGLALVERIEESLLRVITGRGAEIRFSRPGEHCSADSDCGPGLSCRERRCAR